MAWTLRFDPRALRDLKRLDPSVVRRVIDYLQTRVSPAEDAEDLGKGLSGPLAGFWRNRVGDYRVICRIEREELIVLVVAVGHRKDIYVRATP